LSHGPPDPLAAKGTCDDDRRIGQPHEKKNLRDPEESIVFPGIREDMVEIGGLTVARSVSDPGWRWSEHTQPIVGGEWCEARHIGVVLSGSWGALLRDGTVVEFGPDDVYDVPPGHDGYTIGDEPCVLIEWSGMRALAGARGEFHDRVLATLLFVDVVESTARLVSSGDTAWRDAIAMHHAAVRADVERFKGREIDRAGDGVLATFDAPARALRCAASIRRSAEARGLDVRAGVHAGEIALAGDEVRGVAVHEAARIMALAAPGEILVSDTTRALVQGAGLAFEDRGVHQLKGLPDPRQLYAYVDG
jgi:class 3 adenylate cyclase